VIDEIEVYLKESTFVRHGGCSESARRDIQCSIPPVIDKRGDCEPDFADDLHPSVQRVVGVLPLRPRQFWP